MINISELSPEDVGEWILYKNGVGELEKGKIKSWNDNFIFVVYKCDNQWDRFQDYTGCATSPDDLEFIYKRN